jgi:hypothetical protein
VFPYGPNWSSPVLERLEWLTDVRVSHDATEERQELRSVPRRSMEYQFLLRGVEFGRFDSLLWSAHQDAMIVPVWTDPQILGSNLITGATSISIDTTGYDYAPGAYVVFMLDQANHEAVEIDEVSAGSVTFVSATTRTWPAGTRVYPARLARLPERVDAPRATAGIMHGVLRWELIGRSNAAPPDSPVTYDGMDVFLTGPDWSGGVQSAYARRLERLDYALGPVYVDDPTGLSSVHHQHGFLLRDRSHIAAWRAWLHARKGRAVPYWQPQWFMDVRLAGAVGASDTTLTVHALDYAELYTGRRDIAVRAPDGEWHLRRITDVADGDPGEEVWTMDSALGFAADPGQVFITWLIPARLEADAVEIAWLTAGIATSNVAVRSVRA